MMIKKSLLEGLIRECVREVIKQSKINEAFGDDETQGASAPPADGQGSADQPAIPQDKPQDTGSSEKETPEPEAPTPQVKGVVFVNPRDKSKLTNITIPSNSNDAQIERALHRYASSTGGPNTKVAMSTIRAVKPSIKNPTSVVYVYLGKYDPESSETFLMADKSLQVAKENSIPATDIYEPSPVAPQGFEPLAADAPEFADKLQKAGQAQAPESDDVQPTDVPDPETDIDGPLYAPERKPVKDEDEPVNELRHVIKRMVQEVLSRK